jgi:hypothetical protein
MEAQLRYRKQLGSMAFGQQPPAKAKKAAARTPLAENVQPPAAERKATPRIDFVRRNVDLAARTKSRQKVKPSPSRKELILNACRQPGEIPETIAQRKRDMIAAKNPPKEQRCPPGCRMLSEEEKLESLENLQAQKAEIEEVLGHAPLRIESQSLLRQQREMEQQLRDIEHSMDQLKKKYVFVPE